MNGKALIDDQSWPTQLTLRRIMSHVCPTISDRQQLMSAVTLQIAIMVTVLGSLVWLATRRSRPRGAQRRSGNNSWSSDAVYNAGEGGQHFGFSGDDGGSSNAGGSGDSGGGDSGGLRGGRRGGG